MGFEILMGIIALAVAWAIWTYNRFIRQRHRVEEAWSGIDVQLKRRANLVPNLVETVKGYAEHEREALKEVTEMRTAGNGSVAQRARTESLLGKAIGNLIAVAEDYPELRANENFLRLQGDLNEVEDQIQYARRYYNGSARDWNVLAQSFPSVLIASAFNFTEAEYFETTDPGDRDVPDVRF